MNKYILQNITRPESSLIEQFKNLDVSTVYEAQGQKGLLREYMRPLKQGQKVCGPAVTVICPAGDNLMIHAAIEQCQPGDVLVIATIGESVAGMIGELIVMALKERGVQGVIIDAGARDVSEIRQLNFPVWSKAIHSQGTTKIKGGWVNAPAVCAGVKVHPGDLILADDDGIVAVKRVEIETVLQLSRNRMQKEGETKEKILSGELSLDFYNLRETLKKENVQYYDSIKEVQD